MSKRVLEKHINVLFRDASALGGLLFSVFVLLLVFVLGPISLFYRLLDGMIVLFVMAVVVRHFYFKTRPTHEAPLNWLERIEASAFPSVHAGRAWLLAILFSWHFWNPYLAVLLGLLAVLVCASRLWLEEHDFADVFFGSVFGALTAALVLWLL